MQFFLNGYRWKFFNTVWSKSEVNINYNNVSIIHLRYEFLKVYFWKYKLLKRFLLGLY